MKRFGTSIRRRLLIRLLGPLAILLALGAVGTFVLARYIGTTVFDRWLYDSAMTLAQQVEYKGGAKFRLPRTAVEMFEWDRDDYMFYSVSTSGGRQLFGNAPLPKLPTSSEMGKPRFFDGTVRGKTIRIVTVLIPDPAAPKTPIIIRVAETNTKRRMLVGQILAIGIPLQLLLLTLVCVAIWYAVQSSLRKLDGVAAYVAGFEPDRLSIIDDVDQMPSELQPLLNAVNTLITKLSDAQASERRFITNAAHQLRTPLATLQVQTELTLRDSDPAHGDALRKQLRALSRLQHVVHQLLTLARSEPSALASKPMAPLDLAVLSRNILETWFDFANERNVDLGYEGPEEGIVVEGEPHLINELIGNLVDNAIRYGGKGGRVTLSVTADPITLAVEDNGPGISPADRPFLIERFYRSAATSATESGCGLGLAIACEIAARHGAELVFPDRADEAGARVEVRFA
ncbi:MAG TPA: sensor histidine kinase N-terminal domain-containing protein [Sphingobium sp.]|uniref:sensor histidine kinase n=1 Tax=Sphingobium sp. TaxID=1912891 RepID=UPI002ED188AC